MKRPYVYFILAMTIILVLTGCPSPVSVTPTPTPTPGPTMYSFNATSDGHGTVSWTPTGGSFETGSSITVTSTPSAGSVFTAWRDASGTIVSTNNPYSFTITQNTVLLADHASASGQYEISINSPHGTVAISPAKEWYDTGEVVSVSLPLSSDSPGYRFNGWSGGLAGANRSQSVTVGTSDIIINANFIERWTILVHLAVDNNIDYEFEENYGILTNYLTTLETVEDNDVNDVLDIMVLMDSYDATDPQGTGYTSPFTDGYYKLTGGSFNGDLLQATGEINSGSVATTNSFVDWAFSHSAGKRVMYSVFNHGSGFGDENANGTYGIGFDDSNDDSLSHSELQQTTAYIKSKAGRNLDLFYPYACLMGGVELAWEVRNNVDVLLFSEEVFPAEEWSYEALNSIVSDPDITAEGLATAFCDSAYTYFSGAMIDRSFTLAAIDLTRVQPLYNALNGFATAANSWIGSNAARAKSMDFAASSALGMNQYPFYIDLGTFMDEVDSKVGGFSSQTTAVRNAIADAVLYKRTFTAAAEQRSPDYDDACGISIFHNLWMWQRYPDTPKPTYDPAIYKSILAFGSSNAWSNYVQKVYGLIGSGTLAQDSYEPDGLADTITNTLLPGAGNAQIHSFNPGTAGQDWDLLAVSLVSGQSYTFETSFATTPTFSMMILIDNTKSTILAMSNNAMYVFAPCGKLNFTASSTGTYYLAVIDGMGLYGDYKVSYGTGTWQPSPKWSTDITPGMNIPGIKMPELNFKK
jgi:hypothetical protein